MAKFEVVTTVARLSELESHWDVLWRETGALSFQSYPWTAAWVAHMGPSYSLKIGLVWRDTGTLCAVMPMAVRNAYGLRILEWAGQEVIDHCDGLGSLSDLEIAWNAVRGSGGIDVIRLRHIASGTRITALFDSKGFAPDDVSPTLVSTWGSGDAWFRGLTSKKRGMINRGHRILEQQGSVSIECYDSVSDDALLEQIIRLKVEWLHVTKSKSYLFEEDDPKRLIALVGALEQVGRLRLFVIRCGDDVVAASINIVDGPRVHGFFATYNPKFNRASPGILLLAALIRWAFDNGITDINIGRGEDNYKLAFANGRARLLTFVAAVRPHGHVALLAHRLLGQYTAYRNRRSDAIQAASAPAEATS